MLIFVTLIASAFAAPIDLDGDAWTVDAGDCDDNDPQVYPGARELDDDLDNDCNDCIDDVDLDEDGYGGGTCGPDCDDDDPDVSPATAEVPYDGIDQDCTSATPDDDLDADGYSLATDCDDTNARQSPAAEEICDTLDNNCDGATDEGVVQDWFTDADGDGSGDPSSLVQACGDPGGMVGDGSDCDDSDAARYPGNVEVCDAMDNDCDDATLDPVGCDEPLDTGEMVIRAEGCGCASGGATALGWPLLLALAATRRSSRRRS